jgi:hypothetical protein
MLVLLELNNELQTENCLGGDAFLCVNNPLALETLNLVAFVWHYYCSHLNFQH